MQRITITIDDDLLEIIDRLGERRGYASRSEALRDLVREAATREQAAINDAMTCYATLSYVYEHGTRDLSRRLTTVQHDHHDLSISTLHIHVDGNDCLEVSVLKGSVGEVKSFADSVVTQRGVRFGNLHIIPSDPTVRKTDDHHHQHPHE